MTYDIFPTSDKMRNFVTTKGRAEKYPWSILEVGQSFVVPLKDAKLTTLRTSAYRYSNRHGKLFKVTVHDDVYEVGRIK